MGIIKKGILGGVSGKVGNVVGGSLNGVHYLRSLPSGMRQANTPSQLAQRERFGMMVKFLRPMKELISIGFKAEASRMNPFNAAVSFNLRNALSGDQETGFSIDYARVALSLGSRSGMSEAAMESPEASILSLQWADNGTMKGASADDILFLAAFNEAKGDAIVELNLATRQASAALLKLPAEWSGETVHVFAGFLASSVLLGTVKPDRISRSQYLGAITPA